MNFLATKQEQRLFLMQAHKNVLTLKENQKENLLKPAYQISNKDIQELLGDSSAFSSDEFEGYIEKLQK